MHAFLELFRHFKFYFYFGFYFYDLLFSSSTVSAPAWSEPKMTVGQSFQLQHFVRRSQSLALYRSLLRAARGAPADSRGDLAREIRREFRAAALVDDPDQHTFLLSQGRQQLVQLQQMFHLTARDLSKV